MLGQTQNVMEQILSLTCPFDKTPLIAVRDRIQGWRWYSCPNCERDYSPSSRTQEEVQTDYEHQIEQERENLARLASRPGV